ncbi:hypothetical protein ABTH20_19715, partial [Acinetobacter baumannii]
RSFTFAVVDHVAVFITFATMTVAATTAAATTRVGAAFGSFRTFDAICAFGTFDLCSFHLGGLLVIGQGHGTSSNRYACGGCTGSQSGFQRQ